MNFPDKNIRGSAVIIYQNIGKSIKKEGTWKIKQKAADKPIQWKINPSDRFVLLQTLLNEKTDRQDNKNERFDGMSVGIELVFLLQK